MLWYVEANHCAPNVGERTIFDEIEAHLARSLSPTTTMVAITFPRNEIEALAVRVRQERLKARAKHWPIFLIETDLDELSAEDVLAVLALNVAAKLRSMPDDEATEHFSWTEGTIRRTESQDTIRFSVNIPAQPRSPTRPSVMRSG